MIKVYLLRGIIGHGPVDTVTVDATGIMTGADLLEILRKPEWEGIKLALACEGKKLSAAELAEPIEDGRQYVICPDIQGVVEIAILGVLFVASMLYSRAQYAKLQRKLKDPQTRGDVSSPVYSWDGVQTNYGVGFPVPIAYGEHDLGGQVIHQAVFIGAGVEVYETALALCEGRIHSIGGVTGGTTGEADGLGSITAFPGPALLPTDIRLNGVKLDATNSTPGALVSLRMGEVTQTPIPQIGAASTVLTVSQELNSVGSSFLLEVTEPNAIRQMAVLIGFPSGLYKNGVSGNPEAEVVGFRWEYRFDSAMAWVRIKDFYVQPPGPRLSAFTHQEFFTFGIATPGPLETRLVRILGTASESSVSSATWRQTVVILEHVFSYPRTALFAMQVLASESLYGTQPQIRVKGKWRKVRVYGVTGETATGLSTNYYWDVPAVGDAYYGIWSNPPGQNPAWIFLDFLMAKHGLGPYLSTLGIDFEAIRDWADYCDLNLGDGRPIFQCDIAIDKSMDAWEILGRICATGRAVPYIKGNTVSVWYQYAALHGRGSNVVAARTRTQLFTTANVEALQIDYMPARRPTVIDVQYLDRAKEYSQQVVSIEDPDASNLNKPYKLGAEQLRRQTIQLPGVTRSSQARREALYMHRVNRITKTQATLMVGPEALAAEIGDVIGVQDHFVRPYDKDSAACRITSADGTVSTVTLDVPITVVGADGPRLVVRQQDGTITTATVTNADGVVAAGGNVTLAASVTVYKGAPAVFGADTKTVRDYQIVAINTTAELKREIIGIEWHAEVHTEPSSITEEAIEDFVESDDYATVVTPQATSLTVRRGMDGLYVIGWEHDANQPRRRVRVVARRATDSQWYPLGESTDGQLVVALMPGQTYYMASVLAARDDSLGNIPSSSQVTITTEEWPAVAPPQPQQVTATALPQGILIQWDAVEGAGMAGYEVRRGPFWVGAEVLYRGPENSFYWTDPPVGASYYMVRARSQHGIYSQGGTTHGITWTGADGTTLVGVLSVDDLTTTPPGTLTDVTYDSGAKTLTIADGKLEGTYVSSIIDGTTPGLYLWTVLVESYQLDSEDLEDWTFDVDGGEALWRTVEARESSPYRPGSDLDLEVDDLGMDIEDMTDDILVGGRLGQVGQRTRCKVEIDYDVTGGGAWTGYEPFHMGRVTAQKSRVRLTLTREDLTTNVVVSQMLRGVSV